MQSNENRPLNVLRFIAALLVISGHIRTSFFQDYPTEAHNPITSILYAMTSLGNASVMVFFALSGYWVGAAALQAIISGKFKFKSYLLRRLVRLWIVLIPALLLTMTVDLIGKTIFYNADIYTKPEIYAGLPLYISHSAITFWGNIIFLQSLIIAEYGYNHPLWSLSYEFWYYIAFPCLILLFIPGNRFFSRCVALVGLLLALAIGRMPLLESSVPWLLGAIAGTYTGTLDPLRAKLGEKAWGWVQLACAFALVAVMGASRAGMFGPLNITMLGIASALTLLTLARDNKMPSRLLDRLSRLSHCTYSLYAIHMPLVVIMAAAMIPSRADRWPLFSLYGLLLPVLMIVIFCVAWFFSLYTERKTDEFHTWLRKRFFGTSR